MTTFATIMFVWSCKSLVLDECERFADAIAAADESGWLTELAVTKMRWGRCCLKREEAERGRKLLIDAAEQFELFGMLEMAQLARDEMNLQHVP